MGDGMIRTAGGALVHECTRIRPGKYAYRGLTLLQVRRRWHVLDLLGTPLYEATTLAGARRAADGHHDGRPAL